MDSYSNSNSNSNRNEYTSRTLTARQTRPPPDRLWWEPEPPKPVLEQPTVWRGPVIGYNMRAGDLPISREKWERRTIHITMMLSMLGSTLGAMFSWNFLLGASTVLTAATGTAMSTRPGIPQKIRKKYKATALLSNCLALGVHLLRKKQPPGKLGFTGFIVAAHTGFWMADTYRAYFPPKLTPKQAERKKKMKEYRGRIPHRPPPRKPGEVFTM